MPWHYAHSVSLRGADDTLDQPVHHFQTRISLGALLAAGNHRRPGVRLQWPLVDDKRASHELRPHGIGLLTRRLANRRPIRGGANHTLLHATAHQIGDLLAGLEALDKVSVHAFPVPLGSRQVAFG